MNKITHKLLDLYIKKHIKGKPSQLRKIEELDFSPKNFLVISSTALGDTLLSTPAIKSLRKSFPEARITALLHEKTAPLFKDFQYIDRVVIYYGGYRNFFRTVKELRDEKPEVALIFHGNGPQDIAFSILSGANFILKHPTNSPHKKYLSYDFERKYQHTIEDRLDLIRKIGGTVIENSMEIPGLTDSSRESMITSLLGPKSDFIGFQPGAADGYKMWPIDNFKALAEMILKHDPHAKIIISGTSGEAALAQKLASAYGDRIINTCGRLTIEELPYLVRRMQILVTNDTGTMHLAIALKVPTISLFSATDKNITGPYQDNEIHKVIQKDGSYVQKLPKKQRDNNNMKLITVDEVYAAYENLVHNRSV